MKILCALNECNDTTIPVENFLALQSDEFDKILLVFNASNLEVQKFLERNGYGNDVTVYGLKNVGFFGRIWRMVSILRLERPNVLHAHHTNSALLCSILASFFVSVKFIFTIHNYFSSYKALNKAVFLFIYIISDGLVANSNNTKSSVPRIIRRNKIAVIYNGVSTNRLDSSPPKILKDSLAVGTISRLVDQKDHDTLIRAFKIFLGYQDAPPEARLYIIGNGPLAEKLKGLVSDLGLIENIVFTGGLSRSQAYRYLKAFDVFVVSSKFEGFCNAMVEAMFAEIPVIASNVQPLPEVLGDENGLYFEVGNAESLAKQLLEFYRNRDIASSRAHSACRRANQTYSLNICAKSHGSLYQEISDD